MDEDTWAKDSYTLTVHKNGSLSYPLILLALLILFASLSAISGTFNSLFKVLFIFPSQYLFSIGLPQIFSFR